MTINTMATNGTRPDGVPNRGILIDSHRSAAMPCGGQHLTDGDDQECFYPDPTPNSWVQILVLNRTDLSFVSNQDIGCTQASSERNEATFDSTPGHGSACTASLSNFIGGLNASELVVAVNQPGTTNVEPPVGVAAVLSSVGGNHGIGASAPWYNSPDHGAHLPDAIRGTFSAIGVPGWAPGRALSQSSAPNGPMGAGALDAAVTINNTIQYTPTNYLSGLPKVDEDLIPVEKVLFQKATPWPNLAKGCPNATTTGTVNALDALGTTVGLGPDPRAQYYSQPLTYDWGPRLYDIDRAKFQDLSPQPTSFSACEFDWAKQELTKEINGVKDVTAFTNKLAAPYSGAKSDLWATFTDVMANVRPVESDTRISDTIDTVILAILAVVSAIPETAISPAIPLMASVMGATYHIASVLASFSGGSAGESFSTKASTLAVELVDRFDAIQQEIQLRWRNILVADFGKLSTVAECSNSKPTCPDDAKGWSITTLNTGAKLENILKLGFERELYLKLVPQKYPLLVNINDLPKNKDRWKALADNPDLFKCIINQEKLFPSGTGTYAPANNTYGSVYVATNDPPKLDKFNSASKQLFDRMFSPVNEEADYAKGGLDIDEATFFYDSYRGDRRVDFSTKFPVRSTLLGCAYWP